MSLAQAVSESMPIMGTIAFWLGMVAIVAAAIAGARSIYKAFKDGWRNLAESHRKDQLLDQVLSNEGWPNGAENIIEAHQDIYDKVTAVERTVNEIQRTLEEHVIGRAS